MPVFEPIFILGSPRSFTSIISVILGQHPEAYGAPELNIMVTETVEEMLGRFSGLRQFQLHGVLRIVAQLYAGEQTIEAVEMSQRWLLGRLHQTTGELFQTLNNRVSPLRIIDKSPAYCSNMEILNRIDRCFPNAHYLHLVRHPKTQGQSMMKLAHGALAILSNSIDYATEPPTVDPQFSWYRVQQNILHFLEKIPPERQLCMRGEDVLNEPSQSLRQICEWLQFSWSNSILEQMLRPQDSVFACVGPYGAHLGNDINFLKSPAYRPQTIPPSHLQGPLPWRPDGQEFFPEVAKLAQTLGYD